MTIANFDRHLATARTLADQFALSAAYYDESQAFPRVNFAALHEAGLLALTQSAELGGLGGGLTEAQAIVTEIARGEPSTALILAMQYNHFHAISTGRGWPEHLGQRLARENLERVTLINGAQVEPRMGSPSHGAPPETTARRVGDSWRISGHKSYTTGIAGLAYVNVLAITDEPEPRIASFLVPTSERGLHIVETWTATGMRATSSHDIILDEVEVPAGHIIGATPASQGLQRDEAGMAWYFTLIASVYHGVARAAGEWITRFAASYAPGSLGAPIATLPRIQDALGEIESRLAIGTRLLRSVAEDADADRSTGLDAPATKALVIDNAVAVTSLALEIGGNPGLKRDYPLERHHRDALCGRAHAPQNNMIRIMAAKAALAREAGKPAPVASPLDITARRAPEPQLAVIGGGKS